MLLATDGVASIFQPSCIARSWAAAILSAGVPISCRMTSWASVILRYLTAPVQQLPLKVAITYLSELAPSPPGFPLGGTQLAELKTFTMPEGAGPGPWHLILGPGDCWGQCSGAPWSRESPLVCPVSHGLPPGITKGPGPWVPPVVPLPRRICSSGARCCTSCRLLLLGIWLLLLSNLGHLADEQLTLLAAAGIHR